MRGLLYAPLLCIACAPAPRAEPPPVRPPVVEVSSASPEPAATASDAGTVSDAAPDSPPADEGPKQGEHRWPIVIDAQHGPCTLVLRGSRWSETDDAVIFSGIDRVTTEQSDGCAAGVLFDLATEPRSADVEPEALSAGPVAKTGHLEAAGKDGPVGGLIEDLSFDGANDLCLTALVGAYNYSQRCWVFDPKSRSFVRNADLDDMIFLEIDPQKKLLRSSYRAGGPEYVAVERSWLKGKLVTTRQVTSFVGETPKGKPLPGAVYEIVQERRGSRLIKVREGATRPK